MSSRPVRMLVVDDSALYRQSIQNALRDADQVEVVGIAKDGVDALAKIESLQPDLMTLDVEMPAMNGIEVLRELKRKRLPTKAVMLSSFTSEGAQVTTDALMEGAFDFILKPSSKDADANRRQLVESLNEKIEAFRASLDGGCRVKEIRSRGSALQGDVSDTVVAPTAACQAVVLGASTGGPVALKSVLPRLPATLPVPVLVAQHMPAKYTDSLAKRLDAISPLNIIEAVDLMPAVAGKVIIAAGGRQMKLAWHQGELIVRLTDDPPEHGVRPAVDYLVRSAAKTLDGQALAVIMTGMGRDGLEGCRVLKMSGGYVFAQCQQDAVVYGMPKAVIDGGFADRILPLGKVAPAITRHVKRSRKS